MRPFPELRLLAPLILTLAFVTDVALRFVPPEWISFRAWEAALMSPGPDGPFTPNFAYHNDRSHGDLPNLGNRRDLTVYEKENFTTDASGYRTTPFEASRPIKILVVGDSFSYIALDDSQTLPGQLAETTSWGVYGARLMDLISTDKLIHRLHLTGGVVIWEMSERITLDQPLQRTDWFELRFVNSLVAPDSPRYAKWRAFSDDVAEARRRLTLFREAVERRANYSPARIAVTRWFKMAENDRWLPNPFARNVVVKRLRNGQEIGFLSTELDNFGKLRPINPAYFAQVQEAVRATGNQLLVLLVPDKYNVYYPLLEGSPAPPPEENTTMGRAVQLLQARGIPVLDLTPALRDEAAGALREGRYIYRLDDTHWNAAGVKIAVRKIEDVLPKLGLDPSR